MGHRLLLFVIQFVNHFFKGVGLQVGWAISLEDSVGPDEGLPEKAETRTPPLFDSTIVCHHLTYLLSVVIQQPSRHRKQHLLTCQFWHLQD